MLTYLPTSHSLIANTILKLLHTACVKRMVPSFTVVIEWNDGRNKWSDMKEERTVALMLNEVHNVHLVTYKHANL